MKLTGNPDNQVKCFWCNTWTSEQFVKMHPFGGKDQLLCIGCRAIISARDDALETVKIGAEASERAKANKPNKSKCADREGAITEDTGFFGD